MMSIKNVQIIKDMRQGYCDTREELHPGNNLRRLELSIVIYGFDALLFVVERYYYHGGYTGKLERYH